jgi:hypothetical protein
MKDLAKSITLIGNPTRYLLCLEPQMNALLPLQGDRWDQKDYFGDDATLQTPPESLGRYAGVVQAGCSFAEPPLKTCIGAF